MRCVPRGWPRPLRVALQAPLVLVALVFVLFARILATVMLLVSCIGGGSASARY